MDSTGFTDRTVESSGSRVSRTTHRFWEGLAVLGGAILIVHGGLSLICLDQTPVFLLLSWAELVIGLITITIDLWFLTHV